jgi:hypothetical protein
LTVPTVRQTRCRPFVIKAAFWLVGLVVAGITAFHLLEVTRYGRNSGGTWPVAPVHSDHPIANTFGELIEYKVRGVVWTYWKQHDALDILATPCCDQSAPDIVVTAGGTIERWDTAPNDNYSSVEILATEGTRKYLYTYTHKEYPPPANSFQAYNEGEVIGSNSSIGKIRDAFPCNYDHLHYRVAERTLGAGGVKIETPRNPLEKIGFEPDFSPPVLSHVYLARHDRARWSEFTPGGACTDVSGQVDIIAKVSDRDDAGSTEPAASNVGIYDLKWRACTSGDPGCDWNDTHTYDGMPPSWMTDNDPSIEEHFSFDTPWQTTREEWSDLSSWIGPPGSCPANPHTFMILTKGGGAASWNTQEDVNGSPKYPDGNYVLSVRALDYAKQEDVYDVSVCVENGGAIQCSCP